MRLRAWLVFAAGVTGGCIVACSKDATPPPDNGASSSGGGAGSSSGTTGPNAVVKTTTETLAHDGATRKYILSVPTDYDAGKKYPLYIFLHGNPGTAEGAAAFALEKVTRNEAILAYPGSLVEDGWDHSASLQDNADSTFILAMIEALEAKYAIDGARVLLSGWSGGGFMSSAMACRYSSKFRAIGIHAGGAPYDPNSATTTPDCPGATIATLVTHGDADTVVAFDGGQYAAQYWSEHNGCGTGSTAVTPSPCKTYDSCPADKPVEFCFIPGQDHPLWDQALAVEWAWFKALP
jgi:polyhydroxybutyrate depolymerase